MSGHSPLNAAERDEPLPQKPQMLSSINMIRLELQPEIEAQLAAEAQARGLALDQYVEKIVEARAPDQIDAPIKSHSVAEAIEALRELRKDSNLNGLKIKDLIEEGRKY